MKIMIIGYSGAGKTTFAKYLESKLNIPRLSLDEVHFNEGRQNTEKNDIEVVNKFLNDNFEWIIDGNYTYCLFDRRLEEADLIYFLDFKVWVCLFQAIKRYFKRLYLIYKNKGGFLSPDWGLLYHILIYQRTIRKKTFDEVIVKYEKKLVILRNKADMNRTINGGCV